MSVRIKTARAGPSAPLLNLSLTQLLPHELILKLAEPVRVVLATADAYTKFLSKCSRGAATAILREKVPEVAFFDEAQAYELDQAAACLSSGTVQTAIFSATPTRLSM